MRIGIEKTRATASGYRIEAMWTSPDGTRTESCQKFKRGGLGSRLFDLDRF